MICWKLEAAIVILFLFINKVAKCIWHWVQSQMEQEDFIASWKSAQNTLHLFHYAPGEVAKEGNLCNKQYKSMKLLLLSMWKYANHIHIKKKSNISHWCSFGFHMITFSISVLLLELLSDSDLMTVNWIVLLPPQLGNFAAFHNYIHTYAFVHHSNFLNLHSVLVTLHCLYNNHSS